MNVKNIIRIIIGIILLILLYIFAGDIKNKLNTQVDTIKLTSTNLYQNNKNTQKKEMGLSKFGLKTDTSKISINFEKILSGGPGKDGIPAINKAKFLNINDALKEMNYLNNQSTGISIQIGDEAKFYPFDILVWHEIVNDKISDKDISVTFCPLCGSSIVYDRKTSSGVLEFGVSGLLFDSNLLMYDNKTESLWSQSLGKSVVGDFLGTKLKILNSNLQTIKEFKNNYPNGEILSDDTGYYRNYGYIPYGDYETNQNLIFPVGHEDLRFHKKEIFYIVNNGKESVAFLFKDLKEKGNGTLKVGDKVYKVSYDNGVINAELDSKKLSGYFEMWFSWINGHPGNSNVWSNSD